MKIGIRFQLTLQTPRWLSPEVSNINLETPFMLYKFWYWDISLPDARGAVKSRIETRPHGK